MSHSLFYVNTNKPVEIGDNFVSLDNIKTGCKVIVSSIRSGNMYCCYNNYFATPIGSENIMSLTKGDYVLVHNAYMTDPNAMILGKVLSGNIAANTRIEVDIGEEKPQFFDRAKMFLSAKMFLIDNLREPNKYYKSAIQHNFEYNIEAIEGDIVREYGADDEFTREVLDVYPETGMARVSAPLGGEGEKHMMRLSELVYHSSRAVKMDDLAVLKIWYTASDVPQPVPILAGPDDGIRVFKILEVYANGYCLAEDLSTKAVKIFQKDSLRPFIDREIVMLGTVNETE